MKKTCVISPPAKSVYTAWWVNIVNGLKMHNMTVVQIATPGSEAIPGVDKLETDLDCIWHMFDHVNVWICQREESFEFLVSSERHVPQIVAHPTWICSTPEAVVKCAVDMSLPAKKLQLKDVTLLAVEGVNLDKILAVVDHCTSLVDFGSVRILTPFDCERPGHSKILSMDYEGYSRFLAKELYKWFDTSHGLIVQTDGFILNPLAWRDEWLEYDVIGSEFNSHVDCSVRCFNGGFGLRSLKLQELASRTLNLAKYHPEDFHVSRIAMQNNMRLPSRKSCCNFSIERGVWTNEFGFHRFCCDMTAWEKSMPEHAERLRESGVLR